MTERNELINDIQRREPLLPTLSLRGRSGSQELLATKEIPLDMREWLNQ